MCKLRSVSDSGLLEASLISQMLVKAPSFEEAHIPGFMQILMKTKIKTR